MTNEPDWNTDFKLFVAQLIELFEGGATEAEISAKFRGLEVEWEGKITSIDLDQEYVPGIAMSMGMREVAMAHGRLFNADHIALLIEGNEADSWRTCQVGDYVKFTASIPVSKTTKPEIHFYESKRKPIVSLRLTLHKCRKVV